MCAFALCASTSYLASFESPAAPHRMTKKHAAAIGAANRADAFNFPWRSFMVGLLLPRVAISSTVRLFHDYLPADHLFPALVAQGSLLTGWEVNTNRLVERKRILFVQAGKQDFLGARLIRLPGHHVREGVPHRDLDVCGLKALLRHIHVNFRRLTGWTLLASDR